MHLTHPSLEEAALAFVVHECKSALVAGSEPSTIATATARLSDTIGDGCRRSSTSYKRTIWGQSVSSPLAASQWSAEITASTANGPGPPAQRFLDKQKQPILPN